MIEKIQICLAHPKFIGKYVIEKTWKVILLLLVLFLINIITIFSLSYNDAYLSETEERTIITELMNDPANDLVLKDNRLTGTGFKKTVLDVDFVFLGEVDYKSSSIYKIVFNETGYDAFFGNFKIVSKKYADLNDFNLNESNSANRINFLALINYSFLGLRGVIAAVNSTQVILDLMMSFLMIFIFILLVGYPVNPGVRGIFRIRVILHSLVSYFVLYWFYLVFNSQILYLATLIVPYIYFFVAIRNILRIEARK